MGKIKGAMKFRKLEGKQLAGFIFYSVISLIICISLVWSPLPHVIQGRYISMIRHNIIWITIGIILGMVCSYVLYVIDGIVPFYKKTINWFVSLKHGAIIWVIAIILGSAVSAFVSFLWVGEWNFTSFAWILGIEISVFSVILYRHELSQRVEKVFFTLGLVIGVTMILTQPFGHISWDVDSHYIWALKSSSINSNLELSDADFSVLANGDLFNHIPETKDEAEQKIEACNKAGEDITIYYRGIPKLSHLPAGIVMAILRLFGVNFYWRFTLSTLGSLFVYLFAVYLGMKRLKSGKMLLAVIALYPTNMFLATNYSYDYWVNAFAMMGVAYFIGMCQEKDYEVNLKDTIIMCASFLLACKPKEIYVGLLLIPFFMAPKKVKKKKMYYTVCAVAIILMMLFLVIRAYGSVGGTGDLRGGDVNPSAQLAYILSDLRGYFVKLWTFIKQYLSYSNMRGYMIDFAYLGYGAGAGILTVLTFFAALTDRDECDVKSMAIPTRIAAIVFYIGEAMLVATSMYISFNPVANESFNGVQFRYILPLIYPLLAIVPGSGLARPHNRKLYNVSILLILAVVLFLNIYQKFVIRMM